MSSLDQISPGGQMAPPPPRRMSIWRKLMWLCVYGLIVAVVSALLTWNVVHAQISALPGAEKETAAEPQLGDIVSRLDLKPLLVDADQLEIYYPEEWQVIERDYGARLVIQQPMVDPDSQAMGTIMYPKNITISRIRGSLPIDLPQKLILEEDLRQGFGTRSRVANYVVQADKGGIIDLANAKVIKMPATFTLNGIPMSQLNLLVSGKDNSYLISYVDATQNYMKDFPRVWQGLSLLKTTGGDPFRYTWLLIILAGIAAIIGLMSLVVWLSSKRVAYDYENDLSHLLDDGQASFDDVHLGQEWRLDNA